MLAKQLFEDLAAKISETVANSPAKDLEKNAKAMLGGAFAKMDLVTREEFDIQQQILIKTRTKLSEAEARLAALEAAVFATSAPAPKPEVPAAEAQTSAAAPSAENENGENAAVAEPEALHDGVRSGGQPEQSA
ncbi:accessory factor UbiK family protein [Conchiformibius steedae DSM 2580]|uniref:Ubiquinone biosynthesis accessory factor UbiK n=1 Tax=Conchiformibius steedae DSM 2580 TaxID=1121352 RepID=A0AAE9HT91_9NEIS|nr:accessory factor UbiK family protein [Conchiformibius steedae]QMT32709.1 accessory factor UbiK family protein [Conchiformibius steedae]URD67318.1 accessory factor UbiK family protein [Conchiformibius steedae DSM 2580]